MRSPSAHEPEHGHPYRSRSSEYHAHWKYPALQRWFLQISGNIVVVSYSSPFPKAKTPVVDPQVLKFD